MQPQHLEMMPIDLDEGWTSLAGFPAGIQVKMLSNDLDEKSKTGARTRLVRFAPGARSETTLEHDYWEEVFVMSGDFSATESPLQSPSYSCRPPGTKHGPFSSREGAILLEFQYYLPSRQRSHE